MLYNLCKIELDILHVIGLVMGGLSIHYIGMIYIRTK